MWLAWHIYSFDQVDVVYKLLFRSLKTIRLFPAWALFIGVLSVLFSQTGISFGFEDRLLFPGRSILIRNGEPFDIATGDINNDGKIDFVTANNSTCDISIGFGIGSGDFETPFRQTLGFCNKQVELLHLDDDGILDLLVSDLVSIWLYLGNGNGTFEIADFVGPGGTTNFENQEKIQIGDFNGDSHLDLFVYINPNQFSDQFLVHPGNGDGTFSEWISAPLPDSIIDSFVASDFNNDGFTDIAYRLLDPKTKTSNVAIFFSDGSKHFVKGPNQPVPFASGGLTAADVNQDGVIDLLTIDTEFDAISVSIGMGNGEFEGAQAYSVGMGPVSIDVGDFNGDDVTDLLALNRSVGTLSFLSGNGDNTFTNLSSTVITTEHIQPLDVSITVDDINGDQRVDVLMADKVNDKIVLFNGEGNGNFTTRMNLPVGNWVSVVSYDVDGNGFSDLVGTTNNPDCGVGVKIAYNDGNLEPGFDISDPIQGLFQPTKLAVADFNTDGIEDLVVTNLNSNVVSMMQGLSNGLFAEPVKILPGNQPQPIVTGDFDGDSVVDFAFANFSSDDVVAVFGNGDGSFEIGASSPVGSDPYAMVSGDFNQDGNSDLAVANRSSNTISILISCGDGTFKNQITYEVQRPLAIVSADFDSDGILDLGVASFFDRSIVNFSGVGDGTFGLTGTTALSQGPMGLAVGDFNNDQILDQVAACSGGNPNGDLNVALGNGDGTFNVPTIYALEHGSARIEAVDFNNDGKTDLVVGNNSATGISILLNQGVVLGDVDGNGVVNLLDVGPFVNLLTAKAYQEEADINCDGNVDLLDVDPFVAFLTGL